MGSSILFGSLPVSSPRARYSSNKALVWRSIVLPRGAAANSSEPWARTASCVDRSCLAGVQKPHVLRHARFATSQSAVLVLASHALQLCKVIFGGIFMNHPG